MTAEVVRVLALCEICLIPGKAVTNLIATSMRSSRGLMHSSIC